MARGLTFGCWVELAAGDLDAARQRAVAAVTLVRQRLSDGQLAGPLEGLAQVAAARGQWERALRLAGAAAELRERCRVRAAGYERAQLLPWTARAEAALGPAAAEATAAGRALPLDAAVTEALRTGEDPRPPGRLPPLTDRQSEVARLVAAGLSNAQVAARLHLAGSTVARHLASSYLAVGVCSRTQLAAWVSSQSPVPGPG